MTDSSERERWTAEDARLCMYCDKRVLARGMEGHVRWSTGTHGPRDTLPDDYDLGRCKSAGTTPVSVEYDAVKDHSRFACNHCGKICRGKSGLGVHIARTTDSRHPADDKEEIDYDQHTMFPSRGSLILVPATAYIPQIELTEEERELGFEVAVDESLEEPPNLPLRLDVNELRDRVGDEFVQYHHRSEKIDPVEAYRIVVEAIQDLSEESSHD